MTGNNKLPLKNPSTPSFFAPSTGFLTIPVTPSTTPYRERQRVRAVCVRPDWGQTTTSSTATAGQLTYNIYPHIHTSTSQTLTMTRPLPPRARHSPWQDLCLHVPDPPSRLWVVWSCSLSVSSGSHRPKSMSRCLFRGPQWFETQHQQRHLVSMTDNKKISMALI